MNIDFRRIRERKLVEWLVAYAAGAWLVLEGLAMAREAFEWPAAVMRVALGIAALGIAVTAVLAWYHGEKGRQRVSGPELLILSALFVVVGLLLMGPRKDEPSGERVATSPPDLPSVAVLPFAVLGGTAEDVAFAEGMHDELLHRLAKIGGIRVTSRTSVLGIREQLGLSRDIAKALGPRTRRVGVSGTCSSMYAGSHGARPPPCPS